MSRRSVFQNMGTRVFHFGAGCFRSQKSVTIRRNTKKKQDKNALSRKISICIFDGWRLQFRPFDGWRLTPIDTLLGAVYMTPGWLSRRRKFTPVPSHDSIFVYMVPPQNVTPAWVHPGCCTWPRISLQYEISQQYLVNMNRPLVSVWNRSAGWLERVGHP